MNQTTLDRFLLLLLRLGALGCLGGWTWVHFYWEGPYGPLLWHEGTYELAERLGVNWGEFVGTGADDGLVQQWVSGVGWLYLVCSVLALTVRRSSWIQMIALVGASCLMTVLAYAKYVGVQYQPPMFLEHGSQILCPLILVQALSLGVRHRVTVATAMLGLILTFAGHGLYAIGYLWPTPANFYGMTSLVLQVEHETVRSVLSVAGALDLVVCAGIFMPWIRQPLMAYAAVWGFLTAIARPIAGMSTSLNYWAADQFLHEVFIRAPHFLVPLYLFLVWRKPQPDECDETKLESSSSEAPPTHEKESP